jgi:hypothetical protein
MWLTWLVQLIIGVAVAAASAFITVRLSLRRFRSERWWEKKAAAYGEAIKAIHILKRSLEMTLSHLDAGSFVDPKGQRGYLTEWYEQALEAIYEAVDTGRFFLSLRATNALSQFLKDWDQADRDFDEDAPGIHSKTITCIDAAETCLKHLNDAGQADLEVKAR